LLLKIKQVLYILIDETDLPVNTAYIDSLKARGLAVRHVSKWKNAALVYGTESQFTGLDFSFLSNYKKIGRLDASTKNNIETEASEEVAVQDKVTNYGGSLGQVHMLNADYLHNIGVKGDSVLIGVLDEGFLNVNKLLAFKHLVDSNKILDTYDFVSNKKDVFDKGTHGTYVLSCMAALLPGKLIGVSPNATFALYNTEDSEQENPIEEFYYLMAAERADSLGVDIVTASLSYRDFDNSSFDHSYAELNGRNTIGAFAATMLARKGVVVVNSAGNSGTSKFPWVGTPADADSILCVGAVDSKLQKASFSSIGPRVDGKMKPDVAALGVAVVCVDYNNDGGIVNLNGTSFSAPLVAGFAALVKQKFPSFTSQQLIEYVKKSGSNSTNPNNEIGYGVPYFGEMNPKLCDQRYVLAVVGGNVLFDVVGGFEMSQIVNLKVNDLSGRSFYHTNVSWNGSSAIEIPLNFADNGLFVVNLELNDAVCSKLILKIE
jgi:serine protease AprX